jgi:phenol hydroxylase P2 protein
MPENVFIALQNTPEAQPIIEAIVADNDNAVVNESPGMVKIDCPKRLVLRRETVEEKLGLQDIHLTLISLSGNIDEDEDEFVLHWDF